MILYCHKECYDEQSRHWLVGQKIEVPAGAKKTNCITSHFEDHPPGAEQIPVMGGDLESESEADARTMAEIAERQSKQEEAHLNKLAPLAAQAVKAPVAKDYVARKR